MAEKTAVYSLGRKGVNLVDDPLILDDGAFTLGQNAQTSPEEAEGGIRKRAGMGMLLIPPSATPVLAILSLPFADPSPGVEHYGYPPWMVPGVPSNVTIVSVTSTSITVSWTVVPGATNYIITVYEDGVAVATVEDATSPATVSGLDPATEYTVGVEAENEKGTGESSDPDDAPAETDPAPPIPSTGVFRVAASGTVLNDWTLLSGTVLNGRLQCPAPPRKYLSFTFDGGLLYLNGSATPTDPASLPAGFQVTSAGSDVEAYSPDPGVWGQQGQRFGAVSWWIAYGADFVFLTWGGSPALPCTLDALLAVAVYETYVDNVAQQPDLSPARLWIDTQQGQYPNPYLWGAYNLLG
jgi:hypothetical protein